MSSPILSTFKWPTNGKLIADVAKLNFLRAADHVLDPTYEKGNWWTDWRPDQLTAHVRRDDGSDFRCLPYPDGHFDAIAYDPPYVCPGGLDTSGIKDMHESYGMSEGGTEDRMFSTPAELQAVINDGLTEMWRLVRPSARKVMCENGRPNGVVLTKCANYVWGGSLWLGAHLTAAHALELGFLVEDCFVHVGDVRAQPARTRKHPACKGVGCDDCVDGRVTSPVLHARHNDSVLFVFRRPPPPKKRSAQPTLL